MQEADVLRVRYPAGSDAVERAKEERRLASGRNRSLWQRMLMLRHVRRASAARSIRTPTAGRLATAGRVVVGGITAATVAMYAASATMASRMATGKTLEQIGGDLNRMFLGDLDEEARAKMETRRRIEQDDTLLRMMGRSGEMGEQARKIADDIYRMELMREKGATALRDWVPVDTTWEQLVYHAQEQFAAGWNAHGGPDAAQRMANSYRNLRLVGRKR